MGTQFLDIVIGRCTSRKLDNFTMFRFVAFFACLAVAAAEPQWVYPQAVDAAHLKTPSGDTVSVQAHKIQHHQLKVDEYAKKGYVPYANNGRRAYLQRFLQCPSHLRRSYDASLHQWYLLSIRSPPSLQA